MRVKVIIASALHSSRQYTLHGPRASICEVERISSDQCLYGQLLETNKINANPMEGHTRDVRATKLTDRAECRTEQRRESCGRPRLFLQ